MVPPIPVIDRHYRFTSHHGTKEFLQGLSATDRTAFLTHPRAAHHALQHILNVYYTDWQELIGDVQLSFILFLHLHCYNSLVHWRDLVSLLCLADVVDISLYNSLLNVLSKQFQVFENLDTEESHELVNLCHSLIRKLPSVSGIDSSLLESFASILRDRFHKLGVKSDSESDYNDDDVDDDNGDDDAPVVLTQDELSAAETRNAQYPSRDSDSHLSRFPIQFAAMQPHEDVLMTCARALDQAQDVSLVREAAVYLEEVEAASIARTRTG